MKERGMIFSAPGVRAMRAHPVSLKSQTRRLVKLPEPTEAVVVDPGGTIFGPGPYIKAYRYADMKPRSDDEAAMHPRVYCPYGVVGDRLWVKEAWSPDGARFYPCVRDRFRADGDDEALHAVECRSHAETDRVLRRPHRAPEGCMCDFKWRSPIFMPRNVSRIDLTITKIRAERLHEITRDDAMAEGIPQQYGEAQRLGLVERRTGVGVDSRDIWDNRTSIENYASLWESIHGLGSWEKNPLVWVLDFEVTKR